MNAGSCLELSRAATTVGIVTWLRCLIHGWSLEQAVPTGAHIYGWQAAQMLRYRLLEVSLSSPELGCHASKIGPILAGFASMSGHHLSNAFSRLPEVILVLGQAAANQTLKPTRLMAGVTGPCGVIRCRQAVRNNSPCYRTLYITL